MIKCWQIQNEETDGMMNVNRRNEMKKVNGIKSNNK